MTRSNEVLQVLAGTWANEAAWIKLRLGFDIDRYQVDVFRSPEEPHDWGWSIGRCVGGPVMELEGPDTFEGPIVPVAHGGGLDSILMAKACVLAALIRLIMGEESPARQRPKRPMREDER